MELEARLRANRLRHAQSTGEWASLVPRDVECLESQPELRHLLDAFRRAQELQAREHEAREHEARQPCEDCREQVATAVAARQQELDDIKAQVAEVRSHADEAVRRHRAELEACQDQVSKVAARLFDCDARTCPPASLCPPALACPPAPVCPPCPPAPACPDFSEERKLLVEAHAQALAEARAQARAQAARLQEELTSRSREELDKARQELEQIEARASNQRQQLEDNSRKMREDLELQRARLQQAADAADLAKREAAAKIEALDARVRAADAQHSAEAASLQQELAEEKRKQAARAEELAREQEARAILSRELEDLQAQFPAQQQIFDEQLARVRGKEQAAIQQLRALEQQNEEYFKKLEFNLDLLESVQEEARAARDQVPLKHGPASGHMWSAFSQLRQRSMTQAFALQEPARRAGATPRPESSEDAWDQLLHRAAEAFVRSGQLPDELWKNVRGQDPKCEADVEVCALHWPKVVLAACEDLKKLVTREADFNCACFGVGPDGPLLEHYWLPDPSETRYEPRAVEEAKSEPKPERKTEHKTRVVWADGTTEVLTDDVPVVAKVRGQTVLKTAVAEDGWTVYRAAEAVVWGCQQLVEVEDEPELLFEWPVQSRFAGFTKFVRLRKRGTRCVMPWKVREFSAVAEVKDVQEFILSDATKRPSGSEEARRLALFMPFVNRQVRVMTDERFAHLWIRPFGVDFFGLSVGNLDPAPEPYHVQRGPQFYGLAHRFFSVDNGAVDCYAEGGRLLWRFTESPAGEISFDPRTAPHLVDVRWCLEAAFRFPVLRRVALYITIRYATRLLRQRGFIGDVKARYKAVQALDHFFQPGSPIFRLAFYQSILGAPRNKEPTFVTDHGQSSVTFGKGEFASLWSVADRSRDLTPNLQLAFKNWNVKNLEILTPEELDNYNYNFSGGA